MKGLGTMLAFLMIIAVEAANIEIINLLQDRLVAKNYDPSLISEDSLRSAFPFLKSTCLKNALDGFLPQCLKYGIESIDPAVRVKTAVKLSICEFKESGLETIPTSCEDLGSMTDCMIELESSSQWWTTYSGNYQRLPTICFENALPYEKEQILKLFFNITEIYQDFNDDLMAQLLDIVSKFDVVSSDYFETFNRVWRENMNAYMQDAQLHRREMNKQFNDQKEDIYDLFSSNKEVLMSEIDTKDEQLVEILAHVHSMIQNVEIELMQADIPEKIEQTRLNDLERWGKIDEISKNTMQLLKDNENFVFTEFMSIFENMKQNALEVTNELEYSQSQALEAFRDHNYVIKNHMLPELTDIVVDFKSTVLSEWQQTSNIMNEDITAWNNKIAEDFEQIMTNLNITVVKLTNLSDQVSDFEHSFMHILRMFHASFKIVKFLFKGIQHMMMRKLSWFSISLAFIFYKCYYRLHINHINLALVKYIRLAFECTLLLLATYMGSKCGALLV